MPPSYNLSLFLDRYRQVYYYSAGVLAGVCCEADGDPEGPSDHHAEAVKAYGGLMQAYGLSLACTRHPEMTSRIGHLEKALCAALLARREATWVECGKWKALWDAALSVGRLAQSLVRAEVEARTPSLPPPEWARIDEDPALDEAAIEREARLQASCVFHDHPANPSCCAKWVKHPNSRSRACPCEDDWQKYREASIAHLRESH